MIAMDKALPAFLKKVDGKSYKATLLDDSSKLYKTIADDIESEPEEAKALLAFLLEKGYVEIKPIEGITLKRDNSKVNDIITMLLKSPSN